MDNVISKDGTTIAFDRLGEGPPTALEGSVEAVGPMRNEVADAMGGKVVGVESYELVAQSW